MTLPGDDAMPVIRTAFDAPACWHELVRRLGEPMGEYQFLGNFRPVDDAALNGASVDELAQHLGRNPGIVLVFDSETEESALLPLLAVDFHGEGELSRFRLTPQAAHTFEMNIAIANMDFVEFARWARDQGGLHSEA